MTQDVQEIEDWPVCPDFDEDCQYVEDCEFCMKGGTTCFGLELLPMLGICPELQRRQATHASPERTA